MDLYRFELRRDTAANWADDNPILAEGEPGFEVDTNQLKIGDGETYWNSLPYIGTGTSSATQITSGTVAYDRLPVGSSPRTVAAGDDSRFTNARRPTGPASGALTGTYPSPTLNASYTTVTPSFSYAGTIARGDFQFRWYNDTGRSLTITSVRASLGAGPTGVPAIFDVLNTGVSVFADNSSRPTVDVGGFTDVTNTVATPQVAPGDYLTVSVVQVGSGFAGANLTLTVVMS